MSDNDQHEVSEGAAPDAVPAAGTSGASSLSRRHLLMGAGMLAVAGVAYARTPKRRFPQIDNDKYEALFPRAFGDWRSLPSSELILPPESQLANKLYEHILTRSYTNSQGQVVMFLVAYSSLQIDDVQLHRPEVCYSVAGFKIASNVPHKLQITDKVEIPARIVIAQRALRNETILYWTRVGSEFPQGWSGQRLAMMTANLAGFYPDGILVRASVIDSGGDDIAVLTDFYRAMARESSAQTARILYNT